MIFNALEHGPKDDDVELSIVADGSDIVIAVRNQGPSIAADLLPTILDPLVRDTSADAQRRLGSVGLGLYIAREILAAHCGTIDVESSADLGSVFTVRPNHGGTTGTFYFCWGRTTGTFYFCCPLAADRGAAASHPTLGDAPCGLATERRRRACPAAPTAE